MEFVTNIQCPSVFNTAKLKYLLGGKGVSITFLALTLLQNFYCSRVQSLVAIYENVSSIYPTTEFTTTLQNRATLDILKIDIYPVAILRIQQLNLHSHHKNCHNGLIPVTFKIQTTT